MCPPFQLLNTIKTCRLKALKTNITFLETSTWSSHLESFVWDTKTFETTCQQEARQFYVIFARTREAVCQSSDIRILASYFSHSLYSSVVSQWGAVLMRQPMRMLDLPAAGCHSRASWAAARCKSCRQQTMNPGSTNQTAQSHKALCYILLRNFNICPFCRSAEERCLLITSQRPTGRWMAAASVKPNRAGKTDTWV